MKKLALGFLVFVLIFSFVACGTKTDNISCVNCGETFSNTSKFCPNCGSAVENNSTTNDLPSNNDNAGRGISNAKDLLNSIASDTTLTLANTNMSFGSVTGISNQYVTKDEFGYVIKNVSNLTIQGNATITAKGITDTLLTFENCKNITITGLSFDFIKDDEYSYLYYLYFDGCENISISNCSYNNADTAVHFLNCTNTTVENCSFNNMYGPVSSWYSTTKIQKSTFENCEQIFSCREANLSVGDCIITGTKLVEFITDETADCFSDKNYKDSIVNCENCTFKNNSLRSFFSKAKKVYVSDDELGDWDYVDYIYEHQSIIFNNCKFTDNIYCYGNTSSKNFVNCSFSNNIQGVLIDEFIGWDSESAIAALEPLGLNISLEYTYDNMETDCLYPDDSIVAQSVSGIVANTNSIKLTIAKSAITITEIDWEINSASGVEPDITYVNNSDKQIAYIYFTVRFYDRMGYPIYCTIQDTDERRLKVTGPVNAGITDTSYWDPIFYNSAVGAIQPRTIEIVFTDGTKQTITNTGRYWYSGSYYGGDLHE